MCHQDASRDNESRTPTTRQPSPGTGLQGRSRGNRAAPAHTASSNLCAAVIRQAGFPLCSTIDLHHEDTKRGSVPSIWTCCEAPGSAVLGLGRRLYSPCPVWGRGSPVVSLPAAAISALPAVSGQLGKDGTVCPPHVQVAGPAQGMVAAAGEASQAPMLARLCFLQEEQATNWGCKSNLSTLPELPQTPQGRTWPRAEICLMEALIFHPLRRHTGTNSLHPIPLTANFSQVAEFGQQGMGG